MKKFYLFFFVLFMLSITIVAADVIEDPNVDPNSDLAENTLWGMFYNMSDSANDVDLLSWSVSASHAAPDCVIYNQTCVGAACGEEVAVVARTGASCNFTGVTLQKGNLYVFGMTDWDNIAQAYTHQRGGDTSELPYDGTGGEIHQCVARGTAGGSGSPWTTSDCNTYTSFASYAFNIYEIVIDVIPSITINFTDPVPNNLDQFKVNAVDINLTFNASRTFNVTLFIDGSPNKTLVNEPAGTNIFVNFTNNYVTGSSYSYGILIEDNSSEETTISKIFYVDTEIPTIQSSLTNGTFFYNTNLEGQFNLTDDYLLFSFNASIDGTQVAGATNLNTVLYRYNYSFDPALLQPGNHILTIRTADGHTAERLKNPYEFNNGFFNSYSRYSFVEGGYVRTQLKGGSLLDDWESTKKKDRYSQTFRPRNPSGTLTFIEESDQPIHIIEKPGKYNDRWIIIGDHWKDYVVENEPNANVAIERINDKKVEVTISGLTNPNEITFNSIGDLNIVTQSYSFSTTNFTLTYSTAVSELESQTMTFDINLTPTITSTAASLMYDGDMINPTKTSNTGYDRYVVSFITPDITLPLENLTFYWNYTLETPPGNLSGNITENQTVYSIGIDNCSTFTTRAINFTIRNYDTGQPMNGILDGYFQVWVNQINNYTPFNLTWGGGNNYGVCIDPPYSSYFFYSQMEYEAPGFSKKYYYFVNTSLDNNTQDVNLYFQNSSSEITYTVTDLNDNPVENVYIHVLAYDLPTNTFSTIEIVNTDDLGLAVGQLALGQWYKFLLYYNNVLELETVPSVVNTNARTFRLSLGSNYLEDNYDVYNGIAHTLTYDNSTRIFDFTYAHGSGTPIDACLKVERLNVMGDTVLSTNCPGSTPSGTIFYTLTENVTGNTYLATSYIQFGTNSTIFVLDTLSHTYHEVYKEFGLSGIFMLFLLSIVLVMVGVWSPAVSVLLLIIAIIVSIVMNIFYLSWGAIISLVIIGLITMYRLSR